MNHPAAPLPLDAEDRSTLEMWARSATAPHRVVSQAKALLMAGDGVANSRIATALGISRPTVLDWRARFRTEGLDSVGAVRPGRGRKPEITADQVQAIVHSTLHETPPGATRWSCRSMAKAAGVSRSTVQRIWDAHGLQPHRVTTFKLSKDPAFVQKLTDIVGLYLNPPDQAVVLCVDEKSQIQALDRTQPGLPMKPGRCGTMTHDSVPVVCVTTSLHSSGAGPAGHSFCPDRRRSARGRFPRTCGRALCVHGSGSFDRPACNGLM